MSSASYARKSEAEPAAKPKAPSKNASSSLRIAAPDDAFEQEADRVADAVMAGGAPHREWSFTRMSVDPTLRSKCACGGSGEPEGECEECKKEQLQRKSVSTGGKETDGVGEAPPIVQEVLNSPGKPLDAETRAFFEPRFGRDFSQVRVHTDAKAAQSARAVDARAYTVGSDVVFSGGDSLPETLVHKQLLAHELSHVVQQVGGSRNLNDRGLTLSAVSDVYVQRQQNPFDKPQLPRTLPKYRRPSKRPHEGASGLV